MRKSGILAGLLSLCIPGLGQIYVLGIGAGIARAFWFWIGLILAAIAMAAVVGLILFPLIWLWCAFDAWGLAGGKNRDNKIFKALTKKNRGH